MSQLDGKVVLITGASSGIGRACAIACSREGAILALLGRNADRLHETYNSLEGKGHDFFSLDVTEYSELAGLIDLIVQKQGRISGFIHSAGIEVVLPLKLIEPRHFEKTFAVNVISAFELIRQITKKNNVNPDGASAILIASVMGVVGQPTKTVYSATKGALISGCRSLALELAKKKIRVNCVSPGVVRTGMSQAMMDKTTIDAVEMIKNNHALGIGDPEEIANACVFLLSDQSKWITGINLLVDGGYTAQ